MSFRPCFLVVDTEHAGSISTRKLVLETAKYNVLTAYSCKEAVEHLERFPRVHGVVLNGASRDGAMPSLLRELVKLPEVKLIVTGDPLRGSELREPDLLVESFAPDKLLEGLDALFPKQARELRVHEEDLERREN